MKPNRKVNLKLMIKKKMRKQKITKQRPIKSNQRMKSKTSHMFSFNWLKRTRRSKNLPKWSRCMKQARSKQQNLQSRSRKSWLSTMRMTKKSLKNMMQMFTKCPEQNSWCHRLILIQLSQITVKSKIKFPPISNIELQICWVLLVLIIKEESQKMENHRKLLRQGPKQIKTFLNKLQTWKQEAKTTTWQW